MNTLPHFPRKWFQLSQSKICKKLKNAIFKHPQYWFLSSRKPQNHFLRRFLWPNFDLNSFWCFASLSQKMVWSASLKNCKKHQINIRFNYWVFNIRIMECYLFNYSTTRRLHRDISTILISKYKLLPWWSYLSKLLTESLESIKRGKKNFWEGSFCYYKILNMEHHTHQISLFRLAKISSQK